MVETMHFRQACIPTEVPVRVSLSVSFEMQVVEVAGDEPTCILNFFPPKDQEYFCAKREIFDQRLQRVTASPFKVFSSTENRPKAFKKEGAIVTY
jgi:hypothetical protein